MKCPKCLFDNPPETIYCGKCATRLRPSEEIFVSHTKTLQTPVKELSAGSTFAGRYQIIEELGRGGMGVVYKAEDTRLKRTVALKFLPPNALESPEAKTRFVHEAQAAAALDHPSICTIYEIDEGEGQTFISMAYLKGESLREKTKSAPLSVNEALEIAMQVTEGLQEAHEKEIIHRDIKSSNILVTEKNQAKILDFGLAKLTEGTKLTRTAAVMGTVAYMSPEQVRGESLDHRTDIWSLGVVLYEILTGQLPFKGMSDQIVFHSILNQNPQPITGLRSGIPLEFERIVNKCLEKNSSERYQSAADLKADLKRMERDLITGGAVLPTVKVSVPHPLQRLLRKIAYPLAGVILVILLILVLPSGRQAVKKLLGFDTMPSEKSLAVLPFTIVGGDSTDQPFCDGLAEILARKLTQLEQFQKPLWVMPTREVRASQIANPSEVRKSLGINLVVTGSMQRIGDMIRLTLNLVDTKTLRSWNPPQVFTDPITNLSTWQNDLVFETAQMLDIKLKPETRRLLASRDTVLPGAFEFYVKGLGDLQQSDKTENIDRAIQLFKQAIELDSQYALAYAGLGEAYWHKYKLKKNADWIQEAQSSCNQALQINDHLVPVYITLGIAYRNTGRYEEAIKAFQHALQLEPLNYDAQIELATAYEEAEILAEAEESYKKAIKLRPSYLTTYSYLGFFYWRYGRLSEAVKMNRQVTKLAPENTLGYNNLGAVYVQLGQIKLAMDTLEKSISIKPSGQACSNLGALYFYQRRYADAVAMLEEAVNLGEKDYIIMGNLADAYRFTPGYQEKAREGYQQAIQLAEEQLSIDQFDTHLRSSLAYYYAASGDHDNALDEITKAREQTPHDVSVLQKCIQIFELTNRREQALQAFQEYIEKGGSLEEVLVDPDLTGLHKDPRFQQLLKK